MPITSICCIAAVAFTSGILFILTRELIDISKEIRRLDQEDKLYAEYEEEEDITDESCPAEVKP
ncbi:MAG: hypothetical protein ACI4J5_09775 [Oscillospiraceae bacterium]